MKPLESQFANWIDSFFHKDDEIPIDNVSGLNDIVNNKYDRASGEQLAVDLEAHKTDGNAHGDIVNYILNNIDNSSQEAQDALSEHNASATAHEDIRGEIAEKIYIADIVNALDSNDTEKPLSASMGKELKVLVDAANGSGGFIPPYDFGTPTPTQQALTNYAMNYIFGAAAGNHSQTELFNGTKVQNLNDRRVWQLANTPNTNPVIFSWEAALVVGEVQRDFTATPIITNEITDSAVTDAKIGGRALTDAAAANTLPATGALTTILQTVRNCLKWLVNQFNTSTGHSHNGTDSRKISYSNLDDKPTIPAAQQQVDWNATSGITSIANKPDPVLKTADIQAVAFVTELPANPAATTLYLIQE
jgi:hypothetical protein